MSRKGDDDFADALGKDVRPLRGRRELRPPPAPDPPAPTRRAGDAPAARFAVEEREGRVFARREDVARRRLADLRAGRTRVDREIDLHGLDARRARRRVVEQLARAQREGCRCVLVIHGAGLHSDAGPVLRKALPGWLLEGSLAGEILAFASAPPRLGGRGASLVLLRRPR